MSNNNVKADVQSLLALLKSTEGANGPSRSRTAPHTPSNPPPSVIPSKRQLDDLLASLNQPGPSSRSTQTPFSTHSAFSGPRNSLIDPFGPVGAIRPQTQTFDPIAAAQSYVSPHAPKPVEPPSPVAAKRRESKVVTDREKREEPGYAEMGFSKALPIISELLEDEDFKREIKKMKADQDALERRLWAKQERIKAEHEKVVQAERDIAKISLQPIPRSKQAQWEDTLASDLADFYTQTCLPQIDGLAHRHREKLQEMGVPGLAGEYRDKKVKERVGKIMGVIEGAMDE